MTNAVAPPSARPAAPAAARATMAAAVLAAPGRFEIADVPRPDPAPGHVRIRLEGCGVCASNLPPWEGREWFTYPMAPGQLGHEGWGVIDALGPGAAGVAEGDRVAFLSNQSYAEYDTAPASHVVPLPDTLRDTPFPGEPLGCAVNIFRRSDVHAGHTVAIVGVGFLGALLVQLCKAAGARVIALSQRPHSLDTATRLGADEAIPLADHQQTIARVAELTGGKGGYEVEGFCDRVIECTGKEWPLQLASELCAVRARLVIAGYHQDGMRAINLQLWNWRGLDVINAHERDPQTYLDGIRHAAELVARGRLDPAPLFTHDLPLHRIGEALELTRDRPQGFVKALVRMRPRPDDDANPRDARP